MDAVGDATEMVSLDALTKPEYSRFSTMAHGWQEIWASVVHGEVRSGGVDRDAWIQWRKEAVEMLERTRAMIEGVGAGRE